MAQNSRGVSPRARYSRSRRRGAGQGRPPRGGVRRKPKRKDAGRRPGPGEEVWDTRDEWARHHDVRHPQGVGVIHPAVTHEKVWVFLREVCRVSTSKVWMKSGGTAGKPGGNRGHKPHPAATTGTERGEIASERLAEVRRGPSRPGAGDAREAPQGRTAGQPRGGAATRGGRRPERCPARG
jgi:hypothetical protein